VIGKTFGIEGNMHDYMHAVRRRLMPEAFFPGFQLVVVVVALAGGATAQESVSKLSEALRSPDEKARIQAIDSLGRLGPGAKGAVGDLTAQLSDKSANVRAHAAHALQLIGPPAREAAAALTKTASDPDAHVRRNSIMALQSIGPEPESVLGVLSRALMDPEPPVRVAALSTLTELGEAALPVLAEALANPDTRYWAALALGELGPKAKPAVDGLTRALEDQRPEVRREALVALAHIGPDASSAVPAVMAALADPDGSVRHSAAFALGRIGPPAAVQAAGVLRRNMQGADDLMRTISAWSLARIEPTNQASREQAIPLLIAALKNKNPHVQIAGLRGLADLQLPPAQWVTALTAIMAEGDPAVVSEALGISGSLGEAATPVLIEALKRPEARWRAAALLARIGAKASSAVPALVGALGDADPEVRREVLFALGSIGPQAAAATAPITKSLEDADVRVGSSAAYALGRIGQPAQVAVGQLRKTVESPDPMLRVISALALVQIAPKDPQVVRDALPVLMQGLQNHNVAVRRSAAEALGVLGPAGRAATKQLQAVLRDPDESVRKAAATALERTGGLIISPKDDF
jgi:HEAT repeat protein